MALLQAGGTGPPPFSGSRPVIAEPGDPSHRRAAPGGTTERTRSGTEQAERHDSDPRRDAGRPPARDDVTVTPFISSPRLLTLHALRLTGMGDAGTLARRFSLDRGDVAELLLDFEAYGWAYRCLL